MKRWTIILIVAAVIVAGLLVWNANRPEHRTGVHVASNGETVRIAEGSTPQPVSPKRRYKLGVLLPFVAAPFWVNEAYGIIDEGNKIGVDVIWLSADGYDNVDKQNSQLEDLITRQVDAILLAATSYTGTAPAVDKAAAAGIPVFAHVTSSASKNVVAAVIDDDLEIGRRQARYMGTALHGGGTVLMLDGPSAAEWSSRRVRGFKEVLKNQYPKIRIVAERFGIPDRADAQRIAQDMLTTFPSASGIFTVADGMAMGAADAARAANPNKRITVTTASFSRETVPYLKAGYIGVNVDENPVLMGRTVVDTAVRGLNGESVPSTVYVPNPSITKANLGSVNAATQWAPPSWRLK
jgi:ABC-type sugar transport system substrate-binding protein